MSTPIEWRNLEAGDSRVECPQCGRSPKDRTCGVTVEHDGSGVAHCFRCGYVETHRDEHARQRPGMRPQRVQSTTKRETLSDFGLELWRECRPLAGAALAYLEARVCRIPPADGDLRWHPALKHPGGYVGQALVALVTDALTREPMTLHRTWIRADGTKPAEADPARMLLGGHRKQGGVIRLWPDEMVTLGLGITEGIETALSLAHGFTPVWSCIDAGNLAAFPVLGGIESLVIAADNDEAGVRSARECARRWTDAGVNVTVLQSDKAGADLNDEVCP